MKKYIGLLCLLIVSILLLSGCVQSNESSYHYITDVEYGSVDVSGDSGRKFEILSYHEGNVLLYERTDAGFVYYWYNTKKKELNQIGVIDNFYASDGSCSYYDGKFFWNVCVGENLDDAKNALFCFDTANGRFDKLTEETLYQKLVPTFPLKDGVASYKGNLIAENQGETYVELYTPGNSPKKIVSKIGNTSTGEGEFIGAACGWKDGICVMNGRAGNYFIEMYDMNGQMIKQYSANEVKEKLSRQSCERFCFLNDSLLYVNNATGASVICDLSGEELRIVYSSDNEDPYYVEDQFHVSRSCRPAASDVIIFERNTNKLYQYSNGEWLESAIETGCKIRLAYTDGEDVLLVYRNSANETKWLLQPIKELFGSAV